MKCALAVVVGVVVAAAALAAADSVDVLAVLLNHADYVGPVLCGAWWPYHQNELVLNDVSRPPGRRNFDHRRALYICTVCCLRGSMTHTIACATSKTSRN